MRINHLQLSRYSWRFTVFYNIQPKYLDDVIITLWEHGCSNRHLREVALVLQLPDTGFTYTNGYRSSVMGINWATSQEEFVNTIVHEIKHLQSDICNYYGWAHDGEQASIVAGDIAGTMYRGLLKSIHYDKIKTTFRL